VTTAKGKINEIEDLPFYFTDNDTSDYLESHDGKLPTSASEVTNWMQTARVYAPDDVSGDLTMAQGILASQGITTDTSRLAQYFRENPTKKGLPTKTEWQTWDSTTGDAGRLALFSSGVIGVGDLTKADFLTYSKDSANKSSSDVKTGASSYSLTGVDGTTGRQVLSDPEVVTWANSNAGKSFNFNGTTYVVNPDNPVAYTEAAPVTGRNGGRAAILVRGVVAYNTKTGQWVVVVPTTGSASEPTRDNPITFVQPAAGEYSIWNGGNNPQGVLDLLS
jgi:hypothetical protein